MEVVPLDETSGYVMEYYLTDVDLSLLLPITARVQPYTDAVTEKTILISLPEYENSFFVFFAFKDDSLQNLSLQDTDQTNLSYILYNISNQAASLSYTFVDDLVPGERLIRMPEPIDDFYSEHLIALKDGWILNLMLVQYYNDSTPLEQLTAAQDDLMRSICAEDGVADRYQSITLPQSEITISVPDTLYLCLATEAPDFYEVLACPHSPGYQLSAVHVFAVRDTAYQGNTVQTLDGGKLLETMAFPSADKVCDEDSVTWIEDFENGQPVIAYESDGGTFEHMLGLRDGWALYTTVMLVSDTLDPDWISSLQEQLMHQLMGGQSTVTDWIPGLSTEQDGSVLRLPLLSRTIDISIPDGYGVDIWQDNADTRDIYLYALDGSNRYYNINAAPDGVITGSATIADMYTESGMQSLCAGVSEAVNNMGVTAESQYVQEGLCGIPSIHTTTRGQLYEQYYGLLDSYTIFVTFTSEDSPITEEESETLLNLLQQPVNP